MGETDRLLEVVRGRNAKTVGLQFPVGLRTKAVELAQELEAKGYEGFKPPLSEAATR